MLFGTTLGALWGLACGYFGGRFDIVSQRVIEFLQSFPDLILAMAIAMALGAGTGTVIVAIAITRIPFGGRVIRSVVLSLKEMPYVEAARGLGASHMRLMFRHILPQCVAPYLILATTHLGVAIIIEASLGFLGVGIPPPTPTWGNMLSDALELRPGAAVVAGAVPRRSPSPSPCSPSTCWATASATCSIRGCAGRSSADRRLIQGRALPVSSARRGHRSRRSLRSRTRSVRRDYAPLAAASSGRRRADGTRPVARHHLAQGRHLGSAARHAHRGSACGSGSPAAG